MKGILQVIGIDANNNPKYAVNKGGVLFEIDPREVGIRNITDGSEVEFGTDRGTGKAILGNPPPVRGIEMEPTSS